MIKGPSKTSRGQALQRYISKCLLTLKRYSCTHTHTFHAYPYMCILCVILSAFMFLNISSYLLIDCILFFKMSWHFWHYDAFKCHTCTSSLNSLMCDIIRFHLCDRKRPCLHDGVHILAWWLTTWEGLILLLDKWLFCVRIPIVFDWLISWSNHMWGSCKGSFGMYSKLKALSRPRNC